MKKLISLMIILALVLSCAVAGADISTATQTDPTGDRGITINKAGVNPWPTETSPTTGRNLDQLALDNEDVMAEGFLGMYVSGIYYPVMLQHSGFSAGVDKGAPIYGSYGDIYYEMAKSEVGHTRMAIIFNDFIPTYVGATRSTRVGYISIRQEWNAPYLFQGRQTTNGGPTDVNTFLGKLNLPEEKVLYDGNSGWKDFLAYKMGVNQLPSGDHIIWNLSGLFANEMGERSFEDHNHTLKFGALPEGGDEANFVYVFWNTKGTKQQDGNNYYYYNMMYEYDEEENAYVRYSIEDLTNPQNNAHLFQEYVLSDIKTTERSGDGNKEWGSKIDATLTYGNAITFANVIVQYINMNWNDGGERPNPNLLGTGNADYFMGGKHYTGVWNREKVDDRTVFYGQDGNEIALQEGRTIIIMLDYNAKLESNPQPRMVKYE